MNKINQNNNMSIDEDELFDRSRHEDDYFSSKFHSSFLESIYGEQYKKPSNKHCLYKDFLNIRYEN